MIGKTTTTRQLKWMRHQLAEAVDHARKSNRMLIRERKLDEPDSAAIEDYTESRNLWMGYARCDQAAIEQIIIQKLSDA